MSDAKEIRTKIKVIKNTKKITGAMQMVAASKMRKAQDRMLSSRPYAARIRDVISHLISGRLEYQHPYLIEREALHVAFIVISTDRGLCGGLNANLLRATLLNMRAWDEKQVSISLCTIGRKAEQFFHRMGGRVIASITKLSSAPKIQDVIGTVKVMLDAYDNRSIDRLYLVHNEFVNTMTQKPRIELLLPITKRKEIEKGYSWDYIYEPEPKVLIDALLIRYIESQVYQGIVENIASEQAARMIAMKNASDNADTIIDDLGLMYNKARQAAITRELSEIVAGAAAV